MCIRDSFDTLRDGGVCLLETQCNASAERVMDYWGPTVFASGSASELNRGGWNWFVPSASALVRMLEDVGFCEVRMLPPVGNRLLAATTRRKHVDLLRAGLSVPRIR